MQLNITTDYMIRTVLYLAANQGIHSSADIAEAMYISHGYLSKITNKLKGAGFIGVQKGAGGGFFLALCPKDITLLDIIQCSEGSVKINRCLQADGYCNRFAVDFCPVHKSFQRIQEFLEESLASVTIEDLLEGGEPAFWEKK